MLSYGQVNHLTWVWRSWKTKWKMSQEQGGSGDSWRRGLAEHQQGWNPASEELQPSFRKSCLFCLVTHQVGGTYRNCCRCYAWFGCKYPQPKAGSLELKHCDGVLSWKDENCADNLFSPYITESTRLLLFWILKFWSQCLLDLKQCSPFTVGNSQDSKRWFIPAAGRMRHRWELFALNDPSHQPCYLSGSRNNCDSQKIWQRTPAGVRGDANGHRPGSGPAHRHLSAHHSHSGPEWQQSQIWKHPIWV